MLTPDDFSAMNLGIFFDAVGIAGKTELVDRDLQLAKAIRPARRSRIIGADREVERAVEGLAGLGEIDCNLPRLRRRRLGGCSPRNHRESQQWRGELHGQAR